METFIERSQRLKHEIQNSPEIIKAIQDCFVGNNEAFSSGTEHDIHRIGMTDSGIYLVLRKKCFSMRADEESSRFNIYCQNAETLASSRSEGKFLWRSNSPSFCIAVIYQHNKVGIITEDMSEGGKYEMTNEMGDYSSSRKLNGEIIDEVLVDLDACRADGYFKPQEVRSTISYFSDENILEI